MFCWFYRLTISHSNDVDRPVPKITERHISKCSDCRDFYLACNSIGQALSAEAKLINRNYPSLSNDYIMQNIAESRANNSVHKMRYRPIAIAAGIVLVLVLSLVFIPTGQEPENIDNLDDAIADLTGIINPQRGDALTRMIEEPMKIEFQNIIGDTKSAANFLLTCVDIEIDGHGKIVDLGKTNVKKQGE
jgi:hypothetical protein